MSHPYSSSTLYSTRVVYRPATATRARTAEGGRRRARALRVEHSIDRKMCVTCCVTVWILRMIIYY